MLELFLEKAAEKHAQRAMAYRGEFLRFGEPHIQGSCGLERYLDYGDWLAAVRAMQDEKTSPWGAAATTYFSLHQGDGRILGTIQLRHKLTDELLQGGGHIGYAIRPTERNKGYATQQLELALREADRKKIPSVMVSCEKCNAASAAVIRKCGGVLGWEGYRESFHTWIQIYWIDRRMMQG